MKAVILVAGLGSRLRPLTDTTPKPLLRIGNTNTLTRMVDMLQKQGIHEFVFITGHFEEKIKAYVAEHFPDIEARFIKKDSYGKTNTGHSLLLAEPYVRGESFVKFDGDVNFDEEILARLMAAPDDANYICLDKTEVDDEVVKAQLDENGVVTALGKYVDVEKAAGESIGIEKIALQFSAPLFDTLQRLMSQPKYAQEYYEFAYDDMIKHDKAIFKCVAITGLKWVEMDTAEDYRMAQQYFG